MRTLTALRVLAIGTWLIVVTLSILHIMGWRLAGLISSLAILPWATLYLRTEERKKD